MSSDDLVARLRVELSDYYLATMTASEARTARLAREALAEIERLGAEATRPGSQSAWAQMKLERDLAREEITKLRAEQAEAKLARVREYVESPAAEAQHEWIDDILALLDGEPEKP